MRRILAAVLVGLLALNSTTTMAAGPAPATPKLWSVPSDTEIRQILVKRIDGEHRGVGIVVGVIDAHGRRIVAYGASDKGDPKPLSDQTVFEIGSMTKVFTSLLLSDMVRRGEVKLDDPVAKYLPANVTLPRRGGKQITLIDLATHTSGLPRMPTNFAPKDPTNPYADYTVEQMYGFLGSYTLPRDIGSKYEYSNLGGGLLGHALARRAGTDYETLVRRRITGPLRMNDTAITLTSALRGRLAKGHTANLEPTSNWDLPTLAGAGALRSDAKDILTFLGAEMGYDDTPLRSAMEAQRKGRRPTDTPNLTVALAWHILSPPGTDEVVWHNGGTGGYRSFMGFDPKTRIGVVVLTNTSNGAGDDDIGFHLLTGAALSVPPPPPKTHTEVALDAAAKARFVGRYQFSPQAFLTVTRDSERMYAQLTRQSPVEIFPESANGFFSKVVDAQLTFDVAADGQVVGVVLHQNGRDIPGKRVEAPPSTP